MRLNTLVLAATAGIAAAQRPANVSICDYYTTALLTNNTAANQYTVLTIVVNTAVIGNYSASKTNMTVPGILAQNQTYNGTKVNLLPYFNGALKSSNRGGVAGVSINFLDDGGAAPLAMNKPSNGNTTSNQYFLLTHLYEFFGVLLGCSEYGMGAFPAYSGQTSMGNVHKFMDLNPYEMGYFIQQVGLAAASLGVATADVTAVGMALNKAFNYRCEPAAAIIPTAAPEGQSICQDQSCPLAANATCSLYANVTAPAYANGTVFNAPGSSNSTNMTSSNTTSGSGSTTSSTTKSMGAHTFVSGSVATLAFGVIGFVVFLL